MRKYQVYEGGGWTELKRYLFKHECWIEGCSNKSRELYIMYGTLVRPHAELCSHHYFQVHELLGDKRYRRDYLRALKELIGRDGRGGNVGHGLTLGGRE